MPQASSDSGPHVIAPMPVLRPAAELRDISVTYGVGDATVHAVNNVSLEIHRGEVLLLMGPSGSGKSTLLQVLGCIRHATAGRIFLEERPRHGPPDRDTHRR